jgi:hypothetical protein
MLRRKSLESLAVAVVTGVLLTLAAGGRAEAQVGTGGTTIGGTGGTTGTAGGTTFAAADFLVSVQAVQGVSLSQFDLQRFFDVGRCNCATPAYVFVGLLSSGVAKRSMVTSQAASIEVWLGTGCGSVFGQNTGNCVRLGHEPMLTFLGDASYTIQTDAHAMSRYLPTSSSIDAGTTSGGCTSDVGVFPQIINVNLDFDGDGQVDLSVAQSVNIDLTAPPAPTGVTVAPGNEALVLSWKAIDTAVVTDLLGYQILCSRADQYQVFKQTYADGSTTSGPFDANFVSCPSTNPLDGGVEGLSPNFVCSPILQPSDTSYRVQILQNDIVYATSVVAIDNSGNASSPPQILYGAPTKTLSFYDVYRNGKMTSNNTNVDDPGGASGGYCALGVSRPGAKATAGALAMFGLGALGLVIARRRKGPKGPR